MISFKKLIFNNIHQTTMNPSYKTPYIWKNWKLIAWEDSVTHDISHTLHYWWWVFEWIRFYETKTWPKIFRLQDHIDRLFYSARVFDIDIPYTKEELIKACVLLVSKSWEKSWYIRPIVYLWVWEMWVYPKNIPVETVISAWKWWKYLSNKAIKVKISKTRRINPKTTNIEAKITWNYANSILATNEVRKAWFDEWLLLDTSDFIAEWSWENIFFVDADKVYTPALWTMLPWITRDTIIRLLKDNFNITVREEKISPSDLSSFSESFFVWTAAEVTLIASIEDEVKNIYEFKSWESNSLSSQLKDLYLKVTSGKLDQYNNWLS